MNFVDFHLLRPYWLLALIPVITLLIFLLKNKLNQGSWSTVCDAELLPFILQEKSVHKSHWLLSTGAFSCLLMIIALAGPTWERLPSPVFRNASALVIALDLSASMDSTDIKPTRLAKARFKIADILKQRKDGQTALLVYAGDAFTVTPLTEDTETIASQLTALTTDIMPSEGSNTVLALKKAVELLKQSGLQTGEILFVTDGVDYEEVLDTVESLSGYHLSILGVGTAEGAPIKMAEGGFLKDARGNIVIPKLNSHELSQLAQKGKGYYKRISANDSDINTLLSRLNNPVKDENSANDNLLIDQWDEKGPWLLLLVLPLAALQFRKGLLSLALLGLLPFPNTSQALEWNDLWATQDQQAQQAFNKNDYQQAGERFDDPQWKAAAHYKAGNYQQAAETLQNEQSASGLYNLGNALAKSGKLPEALKAYEDSLQKEPKNEDAKHNKAQVEKALEQQEKDKQQGDDGDKSEKGDKKDSEQGEKEKDKSDQKDNSEPSDSDEEKDSDQESNPEQQEKEKVEEQKEQAQKSDEEQEEKESKATPEPSEYDESEQASEQWLNRIPDDPAGLLKRKFKYQYGQRK